MSDLTAGQKFQVLAVQADLEGCLMECQEGRFKSALSELDEARTKIQSLDAEVGEPSEAKQLTIELPPNE